VRGSSLALLVCIAGCVAKHDAALKDVQATDCATCHAVDFNAAAHHAGQTPGRCGDCHMVAAWTPALDGVHPEDKFPVQSGNHMLACLTCHNLALGASTGGANTDCIGCHTHARSTVDGQHAGVSGYIFDASMPHFCLTCHPDGTARMHPESRFPITSGAHSGIACADCHDATLGSDLGGQNVNCTGCHSGTHSRSRMDARHAGCLSGDCSRYIWSDSNKQFCRMCHPSGRGG
jgi:hypothetical protein